MKENELRRLMDHTETFSRIARQPAVLNYIEYKDRDIRLILD
jgi:hypothetical protein